MNREKKNILEEKIDINIEYPKIKNTPTVFINKIIIDESKAELLKSSILRELYIFGAVVKTGEISLKYGEIKQLEFVVVEKKLETDELIYHHLAQHRSVMYKRDFDDTEEECVDMLTLDKVAMPYLKRKPKWKISEASIPTYNGNLFYFDSQIYIPENSTTTKCLGTWEETFYIFLYVTEEDELLIQIYTQETSVQTAEDHYKLEIEMGEFDRNYGNIEVVDKLIKKGDRFLHDYIINHKKTNNEILELLLKYGKSKKFKKEVTKRLKNNSR